MFFDPLDLILSATIILVYSVACIISFIFTFSLDTYRKIDELVKLDMITARVLNPLEMNINWVDVWLMRNNKKVGPILILLSTIDLKLLLDLIYNFKYTL